MLSNALLQDDSFDAVLSIAVIHHIATTERRVRALRELARVSLDSSTEYLILSILELAFAVSGVKEEVFGRYERDQKHLVFGDFLICML